MNAIWSKHKARLRAASAVLPIVVIFWAMKIECEPAAALGFGLLVLALYVLNEINQA